MLHLLFVCSRNKWRSPTAETIYKNHAGINVKSAGTEPSARIKLNAKMIEWADIIFVMERKHKQRMNENFPEATQNKNIVILEIPDEYKYMDADLIQEIKAIVDAYIQ